MTQLFAIPGQSKTRATCAPQWILQHHHGAVEDSRQISQCLETIHAAPCVNAGTSSASRNKICLASNMSDNSGGEDCSSRRLITHLASCQHGPEVGRFAVCQPRGFATDSLASENQQSSSPGTRTLSAHYCLAASSPILGNSAVSEHPLRLLLTHEICLGWTAVRQAAAKAGRRRSLIQPQVGGSSSLRQHQAKATSRCRITCPKTSVSRRGIDMTEDEKFCTHATPVHSGQNTR